MITKGPKSKLVGLYFITHKLLYETILSKNALYIDYIDHLINIIKI